MKPSYNYGIGGKTALLQTAGNFSYLGMVYVNWKAYLLLLLHILPSFLKGSVNGVLAFSVSLVVC